MEAHIDVTEENLSKVAHDLAIILSDEYVLYTKTLNAHWNVGGPDFHSKHLFFESQYRQLSNNANDVAERIRSLGHYAPATVKMFLELTHFTEILETGITPKDFSGSFLVTISH